MNRIIYGAVLLILAAGVQAAEGYSWVDEDGQRHYSDIPKPGAKPIPMSDHNVADTPDYGYEVPPQEDPRASVRKQQCDRARARLDTLENAGTVIQRDELGNERTISSEERVEMIVKTRESVAKLCDDQL